MSSPKSQYKHRIKHGEIRPDPVQERAVEALEGIHRMISIAKRQKTGWFAKKPALPKGLYMHGGVGRGKSMLMDLFADTLPPEVRWRRSHFHEFMIDVHAHMHAKRTSGIDVDKALPDFAKNIAKDLDVLCFDEFHVTDIADAMILGRLFTGLLDAGVVIIATSNWEPDRLYEGGLQRDRFEPFIELLKERMDILHLDSATDYRCEFEAEEGSYFTPLNRATAQKMDKLFEKFAGGIKPKKETLRIRGHKVEVAAAAGGIARFTFAQLCERARGAEDYIEIAQRYSVIFLEGVPRLGYDRRNEAKRLMILIDALYEAKTRLIISAAATPEQLYHGHDHAYEFERTISRLNEMQSAEYQESS